MTAITPERERWRNKQYPNLQSDVVIPPIPVTVDTSLIDHGHCAVTHTFTPSWRVLPSPKTSTSGGQEGSLSYDSSSFYVKTHKKWKRFSVSEFERTCNDTIPLTEQEGKIAYNSQFFYIYTDGVWRKNSLSGSSLNIAGTEGNISYDSNYFYIYTEGSWKQIPLVSM